jgi:hypothetical protein
MYIIQPQNWTHTHIIHNNLHTAKLEYNQHGYSEYIVIRNLIFSPKKFLYANIRYEKTIIYNEHVYKK